MPCPQPRDVMDGVKNVPQINGFGCKGIEAGRGNGRFLSGESINRDTIDAKYLLPLVAKGADINVAIEDGEYYVDKHIIGAPSRISGLSAWVKYVRIARHATASVFVVRQAGTA